MPPFHQNLTQSKQKVVCLEKLLLPPIKKTCFGTAIWFKTMDTPQSVQVIGAEIITQQQAIRLVSHQNINGVYVGSLEVARKNHFSRGYDMSANNMFKMVSF
jgi:iron complex outermembrane receptor protein